MEITDILMVMALFGGGLNLTSLLSNLFGNGASDPGTSPGATTIADTYIPGSEVVTSEQMAYNAQQAEYEAEIARQEAAKADEENDIPDRIFGVGAGAAGGAAIGTLLAGPGIGTAVGAGIGALVGWVATLWTT